MSGIKQNMCKFYVNEEERTIVCVIDKTRDLFMDFIESNFNFPSFDIAGGLYAASSWKFHDQLYMPSQFTGKAVCAPEDKWDEELGKLIAFSRAKHKLYTSFFKRANLLVNMINTYLERMVDMCNEMALKLQNRKDAMDEALEEIMTPSSL